MADTVPFLVVNENKFAWTAVERLKAWPTSGPQTVYLYGPAGAGKTHLARQFVQDSKADSTVDVACVTAGELAAEAYEISQKTTREYAGRNASARNRGAREGSAARSRSVAVPTATHTTVEVQALLSWEVDDDAFDPLQRKYVGLDALVCEDLTELARWPQTQNQLVSLFDEIIRRGGRVLLTASCPPGQLPGFIPRLVTRCRSGVCAAFEPLGETARFELIQHFALFRQVPISADGARRLASQLAVSPRELQEALLRLDESARLRNTAIDLALVDLFLAHEVTRPRLTLLQVATAAARHYGVRVGDLRSESRVRGLALARHCAMFLCREHTGLALRNISAFFGGRQHSTVLHACRRIDGLLKDRPDVRRDLDDICRALGVASPSVALTKREASD